MSAIQRVKDAIEEIKKGNMIIMLDDEDRENEGDLIYSATLSDAKKVNFMASYAKGLICVAIPSQTAKRLELNPMVTANNSSYETAFTVSVDAKTASTGISAYERDDTIKLIANPISKIEDLVRPGHIFPCTAKEGGVLARTGHTEGSVDLCKLAGFNGEAVMCEIMNDDGTMARRDDLNAFAKTHKLKQVYVSDLVEYRLLNELLVKEVSSTKAQFFNQEVNKKEYIDHLKNTHTVIQFGDIKKDTNVKFHAVIPDIKLFLDDTKLESMTKSIDYLKQNGGVLVFLNDETSNKESKKDYGIGAQILKLLNVEKFNLLTSGGKHSYIGLTGFGLEIIEEIQP